MDSFFKKGEKVKVINEATGQVIVEVETSNLGKWLAKNRMGMVGWKHYSVVVKPV
jgi:hypothetical protein